MIVDSSYSVFATIGDPIEQTKSPFLFNTHFSKHCVSAIMVPMRVPAGDPLTKFVDAMRSTRFVQGILSTIPHKNELIHLVDQLGPTAERLRLVNAIRIDETGRLVGEMFDGRGFVNALSRNNFDPRDKSALIIGGGAAGSAIALALQDVGAARVDVVELNDKRRLDLAAVFRGLTGISVVQECNDFAPFDLIMNASPVGMRQGDPLPGPIATVGPNTLVADAVTNFKHTNFLKAAKAKGCAIQTGQEMTRGQMDVALRFFELASEPE